jgi:serine phosphatase RsbU (regulator of sigma subunit)
VQRVELAAGDRLLAYTDGVTEAREATGDRMFGEKRLIEWFLAEQDLPLAELPENLLAHLREFSDSDDGAGSLDDDITLFCLERE